MIGLTIEEGGQANARKIEQKTSNRASMIHANADFSKKEKVPAGLQGELTFSFHSHSDLPRYLPANYAN